MTFTEAPHQAPSPQHFFETINAYQRTAALKAAIELEVFTGIAEGNRTADALARRCQANPRGMRILCDYLVVIGFLTKSDNQYGLTIDSAAFLDKRSPSYLGGSVRFLTSPMLVQGFDDVAAIVRKGGTVTGPEGTVAPEHPIWVEFARTMAPNMAMSAELIAQHLDVGAQPDWKVLDVAAGHGMFGITLARHNDNAQIVALDWPNVLEVARENATAAGVADRYRILPGSAFEVNFGNGYDVVLLTNFLHHFDPATCEKLLRKVHAALKSGGRAATLEFVPNEDRVSPPVPAAFALMMLGSTPSGDAYTFSEYDCMFRNAGFASSELYPLPPTPQQLIISHKR